MESSDRPVAAHDGCPSCGGKGKPVKPITIGSLVTNEARARAGRTDGFRFCSERSCAVAYFRPEDGVGIARSEVRVRIGQKETEAPRPVCYCFGHTIEEIEAEVATTGTSRIADDITEKCRRGLDRCEETNPQGSCCLGNVRRAIKEVQAPREGALAAANVSGGEAEGASCCAGGAAPAAVCLRPRSAGLLSAGGAMIAAVLSSACCWLPLLLIAFGTSAAGVAGFFEAYRPHLLGTTGLLLGGGFYLVYFRKERCAPGEACAVPSSRLERFNKITLSVVTTVVLAFALFPSYAGYLPGHGDGPALAATSDSGEGRVFRIEGMTCAGCASGLQARLGSLPGVSSARVDYESATATVTLGPEGSDDAVLRAIAAQGFAGSAIPERRGYSSTGRGARPHGPQ
jgi:copper chaperone CopZ